MNGKLFGAIILVGAAVGAAACRTQLLDVGGAGAVDLHAAVDLATLDQAAGDTLQVDLGKGDLQTCCDFHNGQDLSECIPVLCVLI